MKLAPTFTTVPLAALVIASCWINPSTPALAQQAAPEAAIKSVQSRPTIAAYALRYVQASDVEPVLKTVLGSVDNVRLGTLERSNQIVVYGPSDVHSQIMTILGEIDSGPEEGKTAPIARMIGVGDDRELQVLLRDVSKNLENTLDISVSSSPAGDRMIVTAKDTQSLDQFENVIAQVVRAVSVDNTQSGTKDVNIRIVWLLSNDAGAKLPNVDASFNEVLANLDSLGIRNLGKAGQLIARCSSSSTRPARFQSEGSVQLSEDGPTTQLTVQGELHSIPDSDRHKLDLEMMARSTDKQHYSNVSAEITLPVGKLVVVGTSPVAGRDSVVLVQLLEEI